MSLKMNETFNECYNVKQGTSLVKNSSQTVEIKDKTNEKSHI